MLQSAILPVTTLSARVAECNVGQEVTVFGLVFVNSSLVLRTVTVSLYRQAIGSAQAMTVELDPKEKVSWDKPIALQPGDHLDVLADAAGVNLLWSVDTDTGANPVATGFTIRGQYSNVATYAACDIVFNLGSSYVAIQNNTAKDPATQPAYWMLLLDGSGTQTAIDTIVAGAPSNLDTLNKIAAAIGGDPNFATNVANALALKVNAEALAAVAFTGNYFDLSGIKKLAVRRLFFTRELF